MDEETAIFEYMELVEMAHLADARAQSICPVYRGKVTIGGGHYPLNLGEANLDPFLPWTCRPASPLGR